MTADLEKLVAQLRGRAQFCRDRGEIKTPELFEAAAAALDPDAVAKMVQESVKAEREACALMIEDAVSEGRRNVAAAGKRPSAVDEKVVTLLNAIAAAIRARVKHDR